MKTSRRSFPWTILATAAVAGASFVGIASYVNGNRTQSLPSDEVPVSVQDVTPAGGSMTTKLDRQNTTKSSQSDLWITEVDLNQAVKEAGFESVRVIGLEVDNHIGVAEVNTPSELIETLKLALRKDKRVKHFQIRIDGELQKTLGHTDLNSPVSVR